MIQTANTPLVNAQILADQVTHFPGFGFLNPFPSFILAAIRECDAFVGPALASADNVAAAAVVFFRGRLLFRSTQFTVQKLLQEGV